MAEKEYIEREAAIKNAVSQMRASKSELCMRERLLNIPAADVRPVVTCGECKHWFENGTDYCSCDRDALLRERDFFCAAGEKREEN